MCGIQGTAGVEDRQLVARMNAATAHRGPDDTGFFADERLSLGHNRLSIIDLSPAGHQPMASSDGALELVFNGEIYNYRELRAQLHGYRFASGSDTEVLLAGYKYEGADFFKKLRGMWALALYDKRKGALVLSRDPFGIKPLYYYLDGGIFAFASELRGLRPILERYGHSDDVLGHRLYFALGYFPAPHSPFLEVRKVLPGAVLSYDLASKAMTELEPVLPYAEEAPQSLGEALDDSIRAHFVADVPVGLFYSGGIDSSFILARAKALGFSPEPFFLNIPGRLDNEYAHAAAQELGVKLTVFDFSQDAMLERLLAVRGTLDEPFADSSYVPTEYLSELVSRTHKVVLSGEGGDEIFSGYHRHNHLLGLGRGVRLVPEMLLRRLPQRVRRAVEAKLNRDPFAAYLEFVRQDDGLASREEALSFMHARMGGAHDELALALDQRLYLPDDLLFKIDRAAMRHGLEGRVPFLDKRLFTAARRHSASERHGGSPAGKGMLKDLLREHLPERLVERPKQGFSVPLGMLTRVPQELRQEALEEARRHPELIPYDPTLATGASQSAYALFMWAGWRKSFMA